MYLTYQWCKTTRGVSKLFESLQCWSRQLSTIKLISWSDYSLISSYCQHILWLISLIFHRICVFVFRIGRWRECNQIFVNMFGLLISMRMPDWADITTISFTKLRTSVIVNFFYNNQTKNNFSTQYSWFLVFVFMGFSPRSWVTSLAYFSTFFVHPFLFVIRQ